MTTAPSETLQAYIDRVVAQAPPLSTDQSAKIASLLRPACSPVISKPMTVSLDD